MIAEIVSTYTKRFKVRSPYFDFLPKPDTCLIVCIPAFKEPNILTTLQSLANCTAPTGNVELIIVINAPDNADQEILEINSNTVSQIDEWIEKEQPEFINTLMIREEAIPTKDAGAGMARKIGMDEAVQRWAMLNIDGPIICLDADCTVSQNYFVEAENIFKNAAIKIGHFQFEHPFEKEKDELLRQGIIQYELHLRCYIAGLKQAGYPNAIHTVGSCMVVRASSYAKAGGMNKRKAGEDFYFLHKLIPLGGFSYIPATVYPSCRVSDRVPFGTGRAQLEWVENGEGLLTYNSAVYEVMKSFFSIVHKWFEEDVDDEQFPAAAKAFLAANGIKDEVAKIRKRSKSIDTFLKQFWQWMDGFRVLKLTHYLRDHGYPNQPEAEVVMKLLSVKPKSPLSLAEALNQFRMQELKEM